MEARLFLHTLARFLHLLLRRTRRMQGSLHVATVIDAIVGHQRSSISIVQNFSLLGFERVPGLRYIDYGMPSVLGHWGVFVSKYAIRCERLPSRLYPNQWGDMHQHHC